MTFGRSRSKKPPGRRRRTNGEPAPASCGNGPALRLPNTRYRDTPTDPRRYITLASVTPSRTIPPVPPLSARAHLDHCGLRQWLGAARVPRRALGPLITIHPTRPSAVGTGAPGPLWSPSVAWRCPRATASPRSAHYDPQRTTYFCFFFGREAGGEDVSVRSRCCTATGIRAPRDAGRRPVVWWRSRGGPDGSKGYLVVVVRDARLHRHGHHREPGNAADHSCRTRRAGQGSRDIIHSGAGCRSESARCGLARPAEAVLVGCRAVAGGGRAIGQASTSVTHRSRCHTWPPSPARQQKHHQQPS